MILREASFRTSVATLRVTTTKSPEFIDITDQVLEMLDQSGIQNGMVVVFSKHTTAAIILQENEPLLLSDLANMLERCAPKGNYYKHNDFSIRTVNMRDNEPPNGHSHCQHICLGSSETIPVVDGKMTLGQFQRVFVVELDENSHSPYREVVVQALGT